MSYVLPDEPRVGFRPELAVNSFWPLLALMLVGPLVGFVWLAFNAWALGSRHAVQHTVLAIVAVPIIGMATFALLASSANEMALFGEDSGALTIRLSLIAVQTAGLGAAFWMMWQQDDAEQWRKTFGEPLGNGAKVFFPLFLARLFLGHHLPGGVQLFAFWVGV